MEIELQDFCTIRFRADLGSGLGGGFDPAAKETSPSSQIFTRIAPMDRRRRATAIRQRYSAQRWRSSR